MKRKSKTNLVIIPGATGKVAAKMQEFLKQPRITEEFEVHKADSIRWNTTKPAHSKNVQLVLDLIQDRNNYILVCNSFGNRVVLEMLEKSLFPSGRTPSLVVVCGFPLWGPKENKDRVDLLTKSSQCSVQLCFVSGTNDEFLNRPYLVKKGPSALLEVLANFKSSPDVHFIQKGKHTIPDCGGTRAEKQVQETLFLDWFLTVCTKFESQNE
jgi:hypothetical protein